MRDRLWDTNGIPWLVFLVYGSEMREYDNHAKFRICFGRRGGDLREVGQYLRIDSCVLDES